MLANLGRRSFSGLHPAHTLLRNPKGGVNLGRIESRITKHEALKAMVLNAEPDELDTRFLPLVLTSENPEKRPCLSFPG